MSYELIVNSRPDADGRFWLLVTDPHGEPVTGFLAKYLAESTLRMDVVGYEGRYTFAGVKGSDCLTTIIRAAAEYYTGNPLSAIFKRAAFDEHIHGDRADTLPVLHFVIGVVR